MKGWGMAWTSKLGTQRLFIDDPVNQGVSSGIGIGSDQKHHGIHRIYPNLLDISGLSLAPHLPFEQ
jgi:hypothetical protein